MSADPNRYKLTAAKELMQSDQYEAARAVLETIPADPVARQWLAWMDENVHQKRKAKPRGGWGLMRIIPLVLACSLCSFIAGFGAARTPATANLGQSTQTQVVAVVPTQNATATTRSATDEPIDDPTDTPTDEPAQSLMLPEVETISFDSDTEGLDAVIGPVDIPTGAYQITLTTESFAASLSIEEVDGECAHSGLGDLVYLVTRETASDGAEALFASNDCRALIEVSGGSESWTLTFGALEPVAEGTLSFSSETEGAIAVIGPLTIPDGTYRATFTTNGNGSVNLETFSGTCNAGLGGLLFLVTEGQATDGADEVVRSTDCYGVLRVNGSTEAWTLEFTAVE